MSINKNHTKSNKISLARIKASTKRGDTFIEVMFAIAVFSLVAVISIAMMNAGIASGERSLELVTARNEINAQAEALRFVHNAYTAQTEIEDKNEYKTLWETIARNAVNPHDPDDPTRAGTYTIPSPVTACQDLYKSNNDLLKENNAFVLNTRAISLGAGSNITDAYITASTPIQGAADQYILQEAPLGARIIYTERLGDYDEEDQDSSAEVLMTDPTKYLKVARSEGLFVVAVKGDTSDRPPFYDFYIQSCWYGSGMKAPTTLDTIIRLYNPETF